MYLNNNETRQVWDNKKDQTTKDLEVNISDLLEMHTNVKEENINRIQHFLHYNYGDITASQLRNVFNLVKDAETPDELELKRIKVAYIAGRTDKKKKGMHALLEIVDKMIESVKGDKTKLKGLQLFIEACVAYHKYYDTMKPGFSRNNKRKSYSKF
jgi:CRISPR type III-A-associated protein Csm2